MLPLWPVDPPYSQDLKSSQDDGSKPSSDDGKKVDEDSRKDSDTTIQVSPIPTTKIHKDHLLDQVIGDLQSSTQTRKMSKNLEDHSVLNGCKSDFLYGKIEEEVYVCQPPGFEDLDFPDRVYKVEKHCMDYIKLLEL
ncbi:hypothetical protein Tco_0131846, partial [Tanacetum coccineum]